MEKNLCNAMLSSIQKEIKNSSEKIEILREIDFKYCKLNVEVSKFIRIIEEYKEIDIKKENKQFTIYCNGNPYIVLNLAIIAIKSNSSIKINIDDTMLGVNKLILEIINRIIKQNQMQIEIEIIKKINNEENIICIDRVNEFNILKREKRNIRFIPYESIDIYSDSEEFEELFEKVYEYAISMNISIDIFDEEGIEGLFKYGKGKRKVIFTKNKEYLDKYKEKNIFINENPFKEEKLVFDVQLINEIIGEVNVEVVY
ncbi:MAG: hypothetical protein HFJ54_02685 [Clostridia bacterium]|nr:hypothetical protein [Clostridia bacterium]